MKKALITGAEGFVGPHLERELKKHNYEVVKTSRIEIPGFIKMNVLDYEEVRSVLNLVRPDYIFHLAGLAFVPSSWQDPNIALSINTGGTVNIFEAVKSLQLDPIIQIACSSEEYGLVKENEVPIKETNPLRPLSPYGASKVGMDMMASAYFHSYGMKIIRTRAFNHEGPGRGEEYVTSAFAKQVALIEAGKQEPILLHGNLEAIRDFTDVRDTVRAYRLAVEKGEPGEIYNIGSGKGHKMQEIIDILLKLYKGKNEIQLKQDPRKMRPSDVPILVCSPTKFATKTGWKVKIDFEKTMEDLLNHWRKIVSPKKITAKVKKK